MKKPTHRQTARVRLASSLLFQTTALTGSLVGLPVAFPVYSRAYAASICSPSSASSIDSSNVATTTVTCTVSSSGTLTTPQYAYGGSYTWYAPGKDGPHISQQGLNIKITNTATINAGSSSTVNMIGTSNSTPNMQSTQYNALGANSVGNDTSGSGKNVSGGAGGAITIVNSGDIQRAVGAGIQATSIGGHGSAGTANAGAGGAAGAVSIYSTGSVSSSSFGIIGVSNGGYGGKASGTDGNAGDGGAAGEIVIKAYNSIAATTQGAGIFAASYGGDGGRTGNLGGGGEAGEIWIALGSSSSAFTGTVSTVSPATLSGFVAQTISTGAAIHAISYGGDAYRDNGGNTSNVWVTVYGSSAAALTTKGSNSAGIYALTYGGRGNGSDNKAGDAGNTIVRTLTGGTITTSGTYSSGIVAMSLGGLGQSKDVSKDADTAAGGAAGSVSVQNQMTITTGGNMSSGIVAISAGAGGGLYTYGSSNAFVWGDQNANSYSGDSVTVTNSGAITTQGVDSHGIVAQSIGGGGGMLTSTGAVSASGNQTVGGYSGGVTGNAVTVTNSGAITTWGGYSSTTSGNANSWAHASQNAYADVGGSIGILAQSIGGGGGTNVGKGANGTLGGRGSGSEGSNGGTVTVTNSGTITTYGSEAHGIVAQSIGGGGGAGRNKHSLFVATGGAGGPGGAGGTAGVTNSGTITIAGDYASGLISQSIGGGGGSGGKATAWGVGASAAVGGSGGSGGAAGTATALNETDGIIATSGLNGSAVLVQSIGGGGGTGGAAKSVTAGAGFGVSLSFGGSGGSGGDGSTAAFTNDGSVSTTGTDAAGITVQSIGGGGGAGGTSLAKSLIAGVPIDPDGNTLAVAATFSHGGSGGSGGDGGTAKATNASGATIVTSGDGSTGLLVQSIGGGGGAGGDSTSVASAGVLPKATSYFLGAAPKSFDFSVSVNLGGSGGDGGTGSTAYAANAGGITTSGTFADGVLVQSIGGGGGIATTGNGQSNAAAGSVSATLSVGLGAQGGDGGDAGTATVVNSGTVTTTGNDSRGIFVQSVGGGGGASGGGGGTSGGAVGVTIGLGAPGGNASDGDTVTVTNTGTITTSGDWADAILAQSIGGGGGMAGAGDSSLTVPTPSTITNYLPSGDTAAQTMSLNVTSGQTGGAGGDGGNVYIGRTSASSATSAGTIVTTGILSNGITAQSVGGGGGAAAVSSGSAASSSSDPFTANLSLGGTGGAGSTSGLVDVYAGSITTSGFASIGVLAQSIGGGGGTGAASGFAIPSIKLNVGGSSTVSEAGSSGNVIVGTQAGTTLSTSGDDAFGVAAQSISGGGGLLSLALGDAQSASGQGFASSVKATFGAIKEWISDEFSDPGTSGDVTVTVDGAITTSGTRSTGVLVQSIAGGGGALSVPVSVIDSVVANDSGAQAYAGAVAVSLSETASIATSGAGAFGILAQSISGGGGLLGDTSLPIVVSSATTTTSYSEGFTGTGTNAPSVSVTVADGATIQTTGANAHGIFAQAIAGGGGIVTTSGADTETTAISLGRNLLNFGDVTVAEAGSITVSGAGSWGIWAQAGATSDITLSGTASVVASGDAVGGIYVAGNPSTTDAATSITTVAPGATLTTPLGTNAFSVGPNVTATLNNYGTIQGSVASVDTFNATVNNFGTFITGPTVAATVYNAGAINIGGTNNFATTEIYGRFGVEALPAADCGSSGQKCPTITYYDGSTEKLTWSSSSAGSSGGIIQSLDIDMETGERDKLTLSGGIIDLPETSLRGTLGILLNPTTLLPNVSLDVITVSTETVDSAAALVLPTLVFSFAPIALTPGGSAAIEVDTADFVDTGVNLTTNEANVATGLQNAWNDLASGSISNVTAGDISLGQVFGQLYFATPANYQSYLTSIASETSLAPLVTATESAISAASAVMSCPAFSVTGAALTEVDCVWGRGVGSWTERFRGDGISGFKFDSGGVQVGGQKVFDNGWIFGGMLGYENGYYTGTNRAEKLSTDTTVGALVVKKEIGPWLIGASIGGGYTSGDSSRWLSVGSLTAKAEGDANSSFVFGRLRGSYEFSVDDWWYMKPMADVDLIYVNQNGYTETGAGALNLIVSGHDQTFLAATPGIEFGARVNLGAGYTARPFANAGVTFLSDDTWTSTARFAALPSMDGFDTKMPIADLVGRVGLGFELTSDKGLDLKVQYNGNFADSFQSQSGSLRLGYRF